jgi:SAM-dependent methyltransferase
VSAPRAGAERTAGGINWQVNYQQDVHTRLRSHSTATLWHSLRPFVPVGATMLEIGCGSGRLIALAAGDCAVRGIGSDVTAEAMRYAREMARAVGSRPAFVQADALRLPFADGSFDCVLSEGVINHFGPAIQAVVREHARVCRHGGRVIITVPNLLHLLHTYHKARMGKRFFAYPDRSFSPPGLAHLARRAGLRPVARTGFAPTAPFEWFLPWHPTTFRSLDTRFSHGWLSWIGYQTVVVAEKR